MAHEFAPISGTFNPLTRCIFTINGCSNCFLVQSGERKNANDITSSSIFRSTINSLGCAVILSILRQTRSRIELYVCRGRNSTGKHARSLSYQHHTFHDKYETIKTLMLSTHLFTRTIITWPETFCPRSSGIIPSTSCTCMPLFLQRILVRLL